MAVTARQLLIVDEDPDFRALVRPTLEHQGFEVLEAPTLAEATRLRGTDQVLVLDGRLPDGDGLRWLEEARQRGFSGPVVFTASAGTEPPERVLRGLEVTLVVEKPVDAASFAAQVAAVVAGGAPRRPASGALEALRRRYAEKLPRTISDVVAAARRAARDPACVQEARSLAHRLHGTAGSYGHSAVSVLAGTLERALDPGPLQSEAICRAADALAAHEIPPITLPRE